MIAFDVYGSPAPKGSGRAILMRGKALHVPSGSNVNRDNLKSWDVAVRSAARLAIGAVASPPFVGVPLRLEIEFRMLRPMGHWATGKHAGQLKASAPLYPATKPDSSKLLRATEDSLIGIVFDDDSRIVSTLVTKVYATPGNEGARVSVAVMTGIVSKATAVPVAAREHVARVETADTDSVSPRAANAALTTGVSEGES